MPCPPDAGVDDLRHRRTRTGPRVHALGGVRRDFRSRSRVCAWDAFAPADALRGGSATSSRAGLQRAFVVVRDRAVTHTRRWRGARRSKASRGYSAFHSESIPPASSPSGCPCKAIGITITPARAAFVDNVVTRLARYPAWLPLARVDRPPVIGCCSSLAHASWARPRTRAQVR